MLKKTITYTDFDDNQITEDLYFNYGRTELIKLQTSGVINNIQEAQKNNDQNATFMFLDEFIKGAYGVKSEDGKRFIKSKDISDEFAQTAAYDALITELTTVDGAMDKFLTGVMPKDVAAELAKPETQAKIAEIKKTMA